MAKAKKVSGYVTDAGVGIQWKTHPHGWGLLQTPAVAVMYHPLKGMSIHGPFLDEDAAHTWVRTNGSGEVMNYYGDTTVASWFVMPVYVPTHPEAK